MVFLVRRAAIGVLRIHSGMPSKTDSPPCGDSDAILGVDPTEMLDSGIISPRSELEMSLLTVEAAGFGIRHRQIDALYRHVCG